MYKYTKYAGVCQQHQLSELCQTKDVKFSFAKVVDETAQQIHVWAKCRDYFNEVLLANQNGKSQSIYGFKYDPAVDLPIDKDGLHMLIKFPNVEMGDVFLSNVNIMETWDKHNKTRPTEFFATQDKDILVVKTDKVWQKNAPLMSFFTFLLKCMCYPYKNNENWVAELEVLGGTEGHYIRRNPKKFAFFMANGYKIFKSVKTISGVADCKDLHNFHNNSGFVTLISDHDYITNAHKDKFNAEFERHEKAAKGVAKPRPKKVAKAINATVPVFA